MIRRKRNPFEVFGLTPKLVAELPDELLYRAIKALYRVLQFNYHPDKGGDPKKALDLNLAFESLNLEKDQESFRKVKKAYVERLSRKTIQRELEELSAQNRKLTYIQELLKERFWQYLTLGCNLGKQVFHQGLALKVTLIDVVLQLNWSKYTPLDKRNMFLKEVWLWQDNLALRRRAKGSGYEKLKSYTLLGSIKRDLFSPWPLLQRDLSPEGMFLKDYTSKESFLKEALVYLTPELKVNHYLFFFQPTFPDRVYLEGLIIKVEEVSAVEFLSLWNKAEVSFLSEKSLAQKGDLSEE